VIEGPMLMIIVDCSEYRVSGLFPGSEPGVRDGANGIENQHHVMRNYLRQWQASRLPVGIGGS